MSNAPAVAAGAPPATDAAAGAPATIKTVPDDIRRRVLGMKATPPPTAEETAAKAKADKEAADKKLAEEKAAADKKKADADAAAGTAATVDKVKKVKAAPPLPENPAAGADGRTVDQVVREVLAENQRQTTTAAPALDPEVQREIDLAAFAERKNPERYTGMADKVKTFYAWNADHVTAKAKELGGERSAEFREYLDSDEYKGLVSQNRPSYARGERAKLAEDLIAARAREEARQEMAPELKALERQTAELRHAPTIKARTNDVLRIVLTDPAVEKDLALDGFAKDPVKFGEAHPDEARIISAEAAEAVELVEEVYRIDLDLVDFNPKAPTPRQVKIRDFMRGQNNSLREQHPNGLPMADGKILVDASTFESRGLAKDPRYRVFTADEIAGMLAATSNAKVLDRLKNRREGISKSIYAPRKEEAAAAPNGQAQHAPDDPPSPGAKTGAAPGTAVKPQEEKGWKKERRKYV